ncbi:MAG: S1 RNA-binding domain-containing protein [Oscillospiraceae bacterium]
MQVEVGSIVEGQVTGITKFGAFVELPNGKTGMVHISEVASTYVNEISEHLTEGQTVKVKIIGVNDDGKISLSIKKADPRIDETQRPDRGNRPPMQRTQGGDRPQKRSYDKPYEDRPRRPAQRRDITWQPKTSEKPVGFEDMLSKFKQTSDDKMSDLKKYRGEVKRGTANRRAKGE